MKAFSFSIRAKLVAVILGITTFSLMAGFAIVTYREVQTFREDMFQSATTVARITAESVVSDLTFDDPRTATNTLERLVAIPAARDASLFTADGRLFAGWRRQPAGEASSPDPEFGHTRFDGDSLHLYQAVNLQNRRIGVLHLHFSTEDLQRKTRDNVLMMVTILSGLIGVSLLLAFRMQKLISGPVLDLAAVARRISREGVYDVRVPPGGADEIGQLCRGFNDMLEQIERRRLERDLAQQQLVNAQLFLRNVIESMPSLLIAVDADETVTHWNQAAETILGAPAGTAIGKRFGEITPLARYHAAVRQVLGRKESIQFFHDLFEIEDRRYFLNVSVYPLSGAGLEGVVIRADDVTDLDKREQQLRQSQKMESIGMLAGGIAHDFNNVLSGIIGTISLANLKLGTDGTLGAEEAEGFFQLIETSAYRAADMVQQLLTLSRKQESSLSPVDLADSMRNVLKVCRISFDKSVRFHLDVPDEPVWIRADRTQLEQVLLNLCVNAEHAMTIMREAGEAWGGLLTLGAEKVKGGGHVNPPLPEAGRDTLCWRLTVSDTGVGIEPRDLSRIFDPFFSTKPKGRGTGLGLAMVYSIVQGFNGTIDVYSEVGRGTRFTLLFPALEKSSGDDRPAVGGRIVRGEGNILVVDDEPIVRHLATRILQACGYTVIQARDGAEGVELFREHHGTITLVLLDMAMPNLSGKETYLRMRQIDPALKVLLSSGFRMDERVEEVLRLGVQRFIQKPYTAEALSGAVRDVILSNTSPATNGQNGAAPG